MATTKPMTARDYRRIMDAKRSKRPTEMVTMPSGFVWELRRPDVEAYLITGRYPQSLVQESLKALKGRGIVATDENAEAAEAVQSAVENADTGDVLDGLVFMRELVREACVNPRIVMGASKDDEIDPTDIDIGDFNFIVSWCMGHKGVAGIEALQGFRKGRGRKAAGSRSNGTKLRSKTVAAAES